MPSAGSGGQWKQKQLELRASRHTANEMPLGGPLQLTARGCHPDRPLHATPDSSSASGSNHSCRATPPSKHGSPATAHRQQQPKKPPVSVRTEAKSLLVLRPSRPLLGVGFAS
mmetsp:Transcript_49581/g.124314  ORF Transcript_49581/g.124314 Transcript_49581/m.124314 type:complete len:113 (-) Transcript_49581:271-609(-)